MEDATEDSCRGMRGLEEHRENYSWKLEKRAPESHTGRIVSKPVASPYATNKKDT